MKAVVVGATGAVGTEMLSIIAERKFPVTELVPTASERSAGAALRFGTKEVKAVALTKEIFDGADFAFFCLDSRLALEWAPVALDAGCTVIDNSSAYRMRSDVPLVVPEVNGDLLTGAERLIANPNCTTAIALTALGPLHRVFELRSVVAASYQAASGAGAAAVRELRSQTRDALDGRETEARALPRRIAFNLFPQIGGFVSDGYTEEEDKLEKESRRILDAPELRVSATCVRVPVERAHSVALHATFAERVTPEKATETLRTASGVRVLEGEDYPTPLDADGGDDVLVGRIRRDRVFESGLAFWVVGDQLRKGAALNAVQIAERILEVRGK